MKDRKCLVRGCENYSDAGTFVGDLCFPCHEMITTGQIHPTNITFIGVLSRECEQTRALVESLERDCRKSSQAWQDEIKDFCIILDPDGWDRSPEGWEKSWNELITKKEFLRRAFSSTAHGDLAKLMEWSKR